MHLLRKVFVNIILTAIVVACVLAIVPVHSYAAPNSDIKKYAMAFDSQYYYEHNPDVASVYGNDYNKLLAHYINNGVKEGRNGTATFNAKAYRENNPDLEQAYGDKWASYHEHYALLGVNENRVSLPGKSKQNVKNNTNKQEQQSKVQTGGGNVIGIYATQYNAKVARATNVALAASRINGVVVRPGDGFSYSQTILPRTTENGYVSAPVIVGKKHSMGIGGGVCQVSSTLYAAMLTAGLPATERWPHSLRVTYIPVGMDATVSGNAKDLKFVNVFDYPIVINAVADNGTLTVSISKY